MIKLIACDLDETLLQRWDKKVSEENRIAIKRASDHGVKFVLCSGRPAFTAQGTLEEIGLKDQEDQYVIGLNGGVITENKGNRVLYRQGLKTNEATALFERAKQYDVGMHVYTEDAVYVWSMDRFGERKFLTGRMDVIERDDDNLDFLKGQEIIKILYFNTDIPYLNQIESELKDLTGNMDVSYSSNRFLEFNAKGVNKGNGIHRLTDLLEIDIEDTIAIGDNINDLPMIREAGIGVAVANASEEIRRECDFVTQADCDHSAVAEVIRRYVL